MALMNVGDAYCIMVNEGICNDTAPRCYSCAGLSLREDLGAAAGCALSGHATRGVGECIVPVRLRSHDSRHHVADPAAGRWGYPLPGRTDSWSSRSGFGRMRPGQVRHAPDLRPAWARWQNRGTTHRPGWVSMCVEGRRRSAAMAPRLLS